MSENRKFVTKTREQLAEFYLKALEENVIPWEKTWQGSRPENPVSKTKYRGINYLLLDYIATKRGYEDTRWATFNQIADKDNKYHPNQKWHLKKGSEGVPVEIVKMINRETKQSIDFVEYAKIVANDPSEAQNYALMLRTYTVFNYSCIEGAPKRTKRREHTVSMPALQEFCDEALKTMGVELNHYGDRAFYSVKDDKIVLPTKDSFETVEDYYATRLHETAHSTGAEKRLNRDLGGRFGSAEYAEEELRAEIASSILFADLHMPTEAKLLDNHKAYIQSWIEILKNDPKILFQAIKDAEKISDYIQEQAPIAVERIRMEERGNDMTELDEWQMEEIRLGLKNGLDVSIYADPEFDVWQMREIRRGLQDGLDVSIYADPKFDVWQMREIRFGLKNGLDVSIYAKPEFDWEEMREIRRGLQDGLDVSIYADPKFDVKQMAYIREEMVEKRRQVAYIQGKIKDDFLNERVSEAEYLCLDEHQDWINDKFDAYKKGDSEEEKSATYETLRDAILINAGFRLIHENQEVLSSDASIMNEGIVGMGFEDEGISF